MAVITSEIKTFLNSQKLGYVATVSSDGKPNISPKGTIIAWSDNLLAFANIRSPDTVMNLQHNPFVEINVIDPLSRKGYLFTGTAKIIKNTPLYVEILNHYRTNGIKSPINSIVIVDIFLTYSHSNKNCTNKKGHESKCCRDLYFANLLS